jgi:hypothetical protein
MNDWLTSIRRAAQGIHIGGNVGISLGASAPTSLMDPYGEAPNKSLSIRNRALFNVHAAGISLGVGTYGAPLAGKRRM